MKQRNLLFLTLQFLVLALLAQGATALDPTRPKVTPPTVGMGTFYGGAKVHVAGVAEAGSKVIVVVRGPSVAEVFNKLGRVGPIWVNTGKVSISGVPALLLVFSSESLNTCLNAAALDRYQLDLESLKKHMRIETKAPDRDRVADDFLVFKAHRATYRITSGSVHLGAPDQGELPYSLDFEMPRSAKPGKYQVSVLECRKGEVANQSDVDLGLVEVGFPALVARLAKEQASLYGIMSIIIAMVAGFGIDFIASRVFKRKAAAR
ncbi:MAG: TIGR02186 family protein [Terriglobia bacterium]